MESVLNIHWKGWCWSWNYNTLATWCKELTLEKTLMLGKIEGERRRGRQRMRWLDSITDSMDMFEQALGAGDGQGVLACCSPWVCKESDTTKRVNWTEVGNVPLKIFKWFENTLSSVVACQNITSVNIVFFQVTFISFKSFFSPVKSLQYYHQSLPQGIFVGSKHV